MGTPDVNRGAGVVRTAAARPEPRPTDVTLVQWVAYESSGEKKSCYLEGTRSRPSKPQRLQIFCDGAELLQVKTKTRHVSLPVGLDGEIEKRVRSGRYGNASDVVRAGLRALLREEMADAYQQFRDIMATLPRDPITPEIEHDVERLVKAGRRA